MIEAKIEAEVRAQERKMARVNVTMVELERKTRLVEAEIRLIEQRKLREVEAEIHSIEDSINLTQDKLEVRERIMRLEKEGKITHNESIRLLNACEEALGD